MGAQHMLYILYGSLKHISMIFALVVLPDPFREMGIESAGAKTGVVEKLVYRIV